MRLLLGAHRSRLAPVRIEQPRLLLDRAAVFDHADLPPGLVLDRLADEADGIEVLDLAARAERRAGLAHRDVHVRPQMALLHVAVAGAEVAQDRAQLGQERLGFFGGAQIGLGHDLHQRDAGPVEIDERHGGVLVVQRLAGILLEMQTLDADPHGLAVGHVDHDLALADDRRFVLADLIALRQIRIEIVLAVEHGPFRLIFAFSPSPVRTACRTHSSLITGSMPGMAASTSETCEFGSPPKAVDAPENNFGLRGDLRMHLHADDDLPVAGRAFDQLRFLVRRCIHRDFAWPRRLGYALHLAHCKPVRRWAARPVLPQAHWRFPRCARNICAVHSALDNARISEFNLAR